MNIEGYEPDSFAAGLERKEAEERAEEREAEEEAERLRCMALARADYEVEKARIQREAEHEECPHDEHEHGYCLECGKDILDNLIDRAELIRGDD